MFMLANKFIYKSPNDTVAEPESPFLPSLHVSLKTSPNNIVPREHCSCKLAVTSIVAGATGFYQRSILQAVAIFSRS